MGLQAKERQIIQSIADNAKGAFVFSFIPGKTDNLSARVLEQIKGVTHDYE
jgi:hypothetical protein